jgi:hypothetical protein
MRYIDPPRLKNGGCIAYWSPSWSAYLDLRVIRKDGPPIAVEIDRADESTAVDKLRDEALRGRPALWIVPGGSGPDGTPCARAPSLRDRPAMPHAHGADVSGLHDAGHGRGAATIGACGLRVRRSCPRWCS